MALDKQINMYSCDTGHFYTSRERYQHNMNCKYRKERNYLKNKIKEIMKQLEQKGYTDDTLKLVIKRDEDSRRPLKQKPNSDDELLSEYIFYSRLISHKNEKAKTSKSKLLVYLSNSVNANINITKLNEDHVIKHGNRKGQFRNLNHMRSLHLEKLTDTDIISVFSSSLSRTIDIKQDEFTDALLVVQVYYFDVFKDILLHGFKAPVRDKEGFEGDESGEQYEEYMYYTSSAGQIRKKKGVFIKQSVWKKNEKTIMCGLTIENINQKGGCNVNKFLAYIALSNSATDEWTDFDIDKSIVINDFETNVFGTFDFIDETDYSITRKTDYVPVTHTDGAGMILYGKNRMVRLPWVKGLLVRFAYDKLLVEKGWSPIIKDIYGKEHDIIAEDIQVIFTKSQFKMWKYYKSWDEYKMMFKKYGCKAGFCNEEEDRIKNAKINYQMLQTITDISDDEIQLLASRSIDKITNICSTVGNAMDSLGINPYNTNMTPFQEAVKLYPALLNDTYAKDIFRSIKNSLLKKYRSGKLEINGKYVFLSPDFYAACEYWFGGIQQPKGLLHDQEVFCWLLKYYPKLDCLRSPHLYKEHAIRNNIAYKDYGERAEEIHKWFDTNAIYTSSYDLISKILQFDVDGDKSLVVADPDFIRIAERNMKGIVPLYYNMRKASPIKLTNETIYNGLNAAFVGSNIGPYSNNISKIWNDDVFVNGTDEEKQEAIDAVKLLCCENNFVIDYAKTLYKPVRPTEKNEMILKFTHKKLPAFFEYAKDKTVDQIENRNSSFVNKLYGFIPDKRIDMRKLHLDKIDYEKFMMNDINITCPEDVKTLYKKLNREYRYRINMKDEFVDNLRYVAQELRKEFSSLGYNEEELVDMLVRYTYGSNVRYKDLLWFCYGKNIVQTMKKRIKLAKKTRIIQCIDCGEWIEIDILSKKIRCEKCAEVARKAKYIKYNAKR